jgi:hypothetical protein
VCLDIWCSLIVPKKRISGEYADRVHHTSLTHLCHREWEERLSYPKLMLISPK